MDTENRWTPVKTQTQIILLTSALLITMGDIFLIWEGVTNGFTNINNVLISLLLFVVGFGSILLWGHISD